jgi:hypothetical protein
MKQRTAHNFYESQPTPGQVTEESARFQYDVNFFQIKEASEQMRVPLPAAYHIPSLPDQFSSDPLIHNIKTDTAKLTDSQTSFKSYLKQIQRNNIMVYQAL